MTHVGIDLEQFVTDPHGSGIQRVLQYLAKEWPKSGPTAQFVVPWEGGHALLTCDQAADLLTIPFLPRGGEHDLREPVLARIGEFDPVPLTDDELAGMFDAWLLAEVSYLPSVLRRFEAFAERVPTVMIGYDTLPMSEPANYRFRPGVAPWASEYFRLLATSRSVVCISEAARDSILQVLRRDSRLPISVAHPGGDHMPIRTPEPPDHPVFMRLGTLEARKRPVEIVRAFRAAQEAGGMDDAELLFVGGRSHSDEEINRTIRAEVEKGGVHWVEGASDEEVVDLVHRSSVFLSIGVEGYGIPVLEAICLGTPVLYDGIQPAAELMQGVGSQRIDAGGAIVDVSRLTQALVDVVQEGTLEDMLNAVNPSAVPRWRDFCKGVLEGVMDSW